MTTQRQIPTYDPCQDLAARWPDWQIEIRPLNEDYEDIIFPPTRTCYVNADLTPAESRMAQARFVAHLDLGHIPEITLSDEQQRHAEFLAAVRLDRAEDRYVWPEIDGEATVPLREVRRLS